MDQGQTGPQGTKGDKGCKGEKWTKVWCARPIRVDGWMDAGWVDTRVGHGRR